MPKLVLKGLLVFLILIIASFLMMEVFNTKFGEVDYFAIHGIFFLIFITLFPRLTLLFSSVPFGGFLWWLGFFFCPRILVATLATVAYFRTNPIIVVISWLVAISGETAEKFGIGRSNFHFRTFNFRDNDLNQKQNSKKVTTHGDTIEAEFKDLSS